MSFDYQANKEGLFLLQIRDYKTSRVLGEISLQGLLPFQGLAREILIGEIQ